MQHVCLPAVHFNTLPISAGSSIWLSATFSAAGVIGTVKFTDVMVYLVPAPGETGQSLTAMAPDSTVTINVGQATCGAAGFAPVAAMLTITTGAANSGKSLLAAASIVAPNNMDLAGYHVTM